MKEKPRQTIVLKQGSFIVGDTDLTPVDGYQVKELKNSVRFDIGQVLNKEEVKDIADSSFWNVIIR